MSLVTLVKYKSYLGITDSTKDTDLTDLQSAVEKRVKEYLHRDIESTNYAEIYDGSGDNYMVLFQQPVTAVTKIEVYEGLDSTNTEVWTTLALGTDYQRKIIPVEANAVILDGYTFNEDLRNYRITYTAGYATIPEDIQLACKELLKICYANSPMSGENRLGFLSISENAGGGSQSLSVDPDIETKILEKISRYKVLNV
jgi:hypothetical protein